LILLENFRAVIEFRERERAARRLRTWTSAAGSRFSSPAPCLAGSRSCVSCGARSGGNRYSAATGSLSGTFRLRNGLDRMSTVTLSAVISLPQAPRRRHVV